MWKYTMSNSLTHFGVMGMRWGVRRYQNEDGSLTEKGKQKVSAQYKKQEIAGNQELAKQYTNLYVKAYNKSADAMNNGGIDKFNAAQRKKYGDNFYKRQGYEEDYEKQFNKLLSQNLDKTLYDFRSSTPAYQKADELVKKYDMKSWDELAKSNYEVVDELRSKYG